MSYIATERLYRTVDDRVVEAGDPDARWLYAVPGQEIPDGEAVQYGLGSSDLEEPAANVCDECGFESVSAVGLGVHQRSHEED